MCNNNNVQNKLKNVYYFNGNLYYQIKSEDKMSLLNKNGNFKNFIVLDITKNKIMDKDEYIDFFYIQKNIIKTNIEILHDLDSLRFKVYKKIKLKD
jgi:hypothetical protein